MCLVDLDINNGDVAIMLQATPLRTVGDLIAFNGDIDASSVESLVTPHSPGLSIVAAPVHLDGADKATSEDVGKLLDTAQTMYDFVVVDTSGSFDDFALAALDRSATIVLVATLDIPSLKGLKMATGTLDLLNFERSSWKLVLNRADAKVGLSVDEFESTVKLEGRPLPRVEPRCPGVRQPWRGHRACPPQPRQQQGLQGAGRVPGRVARPEGPRPDHR